MSLLFRDKNYTRVWYWDEGLDGGSCVPGWCWDKTWCHWMPSHTALLECSCWCSAAHCERPTVYGWTE